MDNSCVEAILVPGTSDFGLFDFFYKHLEQRNPCIVGSVNDKQKSVVITSDTMYLCQYVKFKHIQQPLESIISMRFTDGRVNLMEDNIPDTTRYRVATDELWLYLMYAVNQADKSVLSIVDERLKNCTEIKLHYDSFSNCIKRANGLNASLPEIVIGLSLELTR